jgi:hypothetical protein
MKKNYHLSFFQRLRRIWRLLVTGSAYQRNRLLIVRLAAFNFRRPLEFPGGLVSRYREFAP